MNNLKIVSPWVNFYRELEAMFKNDPAIKIEFDEMDTIKLYIDGQEKYEALSQLLPSEKRFGNVTLKIQLVPTNKVQISKAELFRKAFDGNPAVSSIQTISNISTNDFSYVIFKKEVVQYHNDSLGDPYGNCSTLYQNIASDIFENHDGVYFCTSRE